MLYTKASFAYIFSLAVSKLPAIKMQYNFSSP